ncbi:MAG: Spy/CpxP family protein refolding chaperone [Candidatus Eiseniibacteriota bacterium]
MKSFARQALILPAIIGVLAAGGVGAAVLSQTPASQAAEAPQAAPAPKPGDAAHGPRHARFMPGRHIEGRIAFLQAELKITPAQKAQWDKVATVMRETAKSDAAMFEQMRAQRTANPSAKPDALERMNDRIKFGEARTASMKKFVEAFTPLYNSLSDEQKQTANELFGGRHHGMRG